MGYRLYHHLSTTSSAASTTATVGASLFTELSGAEYYGDKFGATSATTVSPSPKGITNSE